jgi:peptidyl-prolyl cis-trans isomerase D
MARVRHILITVDKEATDGEQKAVRAGINRVLRRAKAGADFALLAKKHSEDEKSTAKGGDLGFLKRGQMVAEFDEVMFALEPGTVSDVVETKDGLHIIKLEAFREGDVSLAEARDEIAEKLYRKSQGEDLAKSKGEELLAKLQAGDKMETLIPNSEDDAKATTGADLKVLSSRSFTRFEKSIPGIGEAPDMVKAAFQLPTEGAVLPKVYEVRGDYYVASLEEREKPSDDEFEKLKDKLASSLLGQKQGFWLLSRVNDIKKQAEEQGNIEIFYTPAKVEGEAQPVTLDLNKKTVGEPDQKSGKATTKPASTDDEQE